MVQITDTARDKIKDILDQNEGKYLRIFLQGGGWGGPRVAMALDEPEKDEESININGIDVLLADYTKPFVDGTTVDYIKEDRGEGFVITDQDCAC